MKLTRRSFTKAISALIPVSLLGSRLKGETGVAPEVNAVESQTVPPRDTFVRARLTIVDGREVLVFRKHAWNPQPELLMFSPLDKDTPCYSMVDPSSRYVGDNLDRRFDPRRTSSRG